MTLELLNAPDEVAANFDVLNDPFVKALVARKARQIASKPGFNEHDRPDIEQELLWRICNGMKKYRPELHSLYSYIKTLVDYKTCKILRKQRALKRSQDQITSLNVNVNTNETSNVELIQTLGNEEVDRRLGRERRLSDEELSDLKMDFASLIATLPEEWQELIRRRATQSMTAIAREMNVPRTTLYDWMTQIRKRFADAGFEKYLDE
jgi:RNA polymerase sigma-70 factor, ECF subfamily